MGLLSRTRDAVVAASERVSAAVDGTGRALIAIGVIAVLGLLLAVASLIRSRRPSHAG